MLEIKCVTKLTHQVNDISTLMKPKTITQPTTLDMLYLNVNGTFVSVNIIPMLAFENKNNECLVSSNNCPAC